MAWMKMWKKRRVVKKHPRLKRRKSVNYAYSKGRKGRPSLRFSKPRVHVRQHIAVRRKARYSRVRVHAFRRSWPISSAERVTLGVVGGMMRTGSAVGATVTGRGGIVRGITAGVAGHRVHLPLKTGGRPRRAARKTLPKMIGMSVTGSGIGVLPRGIKLPKVETKSLTKYLK